MHLIEDHAQNAGIPVRFAASKLAEGDEEIEARLNLDTNEKETLEHIICQMEKERAGSGSCDCRYAVWFYRKSLQADSRQTEGKPGTPAKCED